MASRRRVMAALGMLSMRMGAAFAPSACRPGITRACYLAHLHQIQPRRAPRLARIGAGAVSMQVQRDEGQDAVEPFAYEGLGIFS